MLYHDLGEGGLQKGRGKRKGGGCRCKTTCVRVCIVNGVYDSSESLETSGHGWSSVSNSIFFDVS